MPAENPENAAGETATIIAKLKICADNCFREAVDAERKASEIGERQSAMESAMGSFPATTGCDLDSLNQAVRAAEERLALLDAQSVLLDGAALKWKCVKLWSDLGTLIILMTSNLEIMKKTSDELLEVSSDESPKMVLQKALHEALDVLKSLVN